MIRLAGAMLCGLALGAGSNGLEGQVAGPPELVRLYATAVDSSGQAVTDLTAADFTIADRGHQQAIAFFRKPMRSNFAPLSASEFSNRRAGGLPHSTAVVFDLMNQSAPERLETWHVLSKSLPQLEAGESVYFYLLNLEGELVPIRPIGERLAGSGWWAHDADRILDQAMKTAGQGRRPRPGPEDQCKKTFHQLEVLSVRLAALPGRKNILWITGGVPTVYSSKTSCRGDWVDCGLYVPHLAVTLAQCDVAVDVLSYGKELNTSAYPDPGKWEDKWTPPPFVDTGNAPFRDMGYYNAQSAQANAGGRGNSAGAKGAADALELAQMALLSGGGIYFRQDIRAMLQRAITRDANAFEMAYQPAEANWDNQFHRVQITCKRKGIRIQARERYYALPDSRTPMERMKAALMRAFESPSDLPEVGLRCGILSQKGAGHLDIHIDLDDIRIREESGPFTASLYLLLSARGPAGPLGEPLVLTLDPELTAGQREQAAVEGLAISQEYAPPAPATEIRVIVLDRNTNRAGSLTLPWPTANDR